MKNKINTLKIVTTLIILASCGTTKNTVDALEISDMERELFNTIEGESTTIANEETEYEITIIDPGFNRWLLSIARPEGYYEQTFLENRNYQMVVTWNQRVLQPNQFNPNLYQLQIDYRPDIDYGYEVNYKLYNYFIYFQRKYGQRLGTFVPRI